MAANGDRARGQRHVYSSSLIDGGEYVCWSRMQAEAGQSLEAIVARKERERRLGEGSFVWGVGNAPALIANRLARTQTPVPVVFSVMKSRPKRVDVAPGRTFAWRRYIDANGVERLLPRHSLVTSRGDSATGTKRVHYALMCRSDTPLEIKRGGDYFHRLSFRNASGTGAPVGPSQVTALLKRVEIDGRGETDYEVNLRAWLTGGYWVRLTDPAQVTGTASDKLTAKADVGDDEWLDLIDDLRSGPSVSTAAMPSGTLLI